jgi:CRP-like cAMP-binding protein
LRSASVDGLAAVARATRLETFAKGSLLWSGSDEASWLGIVVHGIVECTTNIQPGRRFYFSGDETNAVGFLDTLADDARWYDARALTDVALLAIQKDDLLDALEDHFDMALACLTAFSVFATNIVARIHNEPGMPPELVAFGNGGTETAPRASKS